MESEEEDKIIAGQIKQQNSVLDTMQRTITKMNKAMKPLGSKVGGRPDFNFATTFKRGIKMKHEDVEGLRDDYEIVEDKDVSPE